jgi:protease PrsW
MIKFSCATCGQHLEVDDSGAGATVSCPACTTAIAVSAPSPAPVLVAVAPPPSPSLVPPPLTQDSLSKDHGDVFGMEDAGDLGVATAVKGAVNEFRQLDYGFLVPFKKLASASLLRKKAVRWVLFFGLYPLVIMLLHTYLELSVHDLLWLIELYFCLFWALYFFSIIQPQRAVWKRAVGYATFTAVVGIPLLITAQTLPIVRTLYAGTESYSFPGRLIGFVLGVGVFEECCKVLPLVIFGLRGGRIKTVREATFLGLLSGLGFAAAEGVAYAYNFTVLAAEYGRFDLQLTQILHRAMAGPLLHGAWAGVVGWFVGVAALRPGKKWPTIAVGIAFMAVLHGLFDVFSDSLIGLALAGATFVIFMAYLSHGEEVAKPATSEAVPAKA